MQVGRSRSPGSPRFHSRHRPAVLAMAVAAGLGLAGMTPRAAASTPESLQPLSLEALAQRCREAAATRSIPVLRPLQAEVLSRLADPPSLAAVLEAADVLLLCEAPDAALAVLSRHSPAPGADRQAWLLLQWRAADAGQNHERAARALRWMAAGDLSRLERLNLPRVSPLDGAVTTHPALDQLADHLVSLGQPRAAAEVLLAGREGGEVQARRLGRAAALDDRLTSQARDTLMEQALQEAAGSGAWGLVAELLDQQLARAAAGAVPDLAPAEAQALQRRLRLSGRIDDVYGEWLLQRRFGVDPARLPVLERQLRSPRDAGGHGAAAATGTDPAAAGTDPSLPVQP